LKLTDAALRLAGVRVGDGQRQRQPDVGFVGRVFAGDVGLRLFDGGAQATDLAAVELCEIFRRVNVAPAAPRVNHRRRRRRGVRQVVVRFPARVRHDQLTHAVAAQVGDALNGAGGDQLGFVIADLIDFRRVAAPAVAAARTLHDDLFQTVAVNVRAVQFAQLAGRFERVVKIRAAEDGLRRAAVAFKVAELVTVRRVFGAGALEGRRQVSPAGFQIGFQSLFQAQAFGGELRDRRLELGAYLRRRLVGRRTGDAARELLVNGDAAAGRQ